MDCWLENLKLLVKILAIMIFYLTNKKKSPNFKSSMEILKKKWTATSREYNNLIGKLKVYEDLSPYIKVQLRKTKYIKVSSDK